MIVQPGILFIFHFAFTLDTKKNPLKNTFSREATTTVYGKKGFLFPATGKKMKVFFYPGNNNFYRSGYIPTNIHIYGTNINFKMKVGNKIYIEIRQNTILLLFKVVFHELYGQ